MGKQPVACNGVRKAGDLTIMPGLIFEYSSGRADTPAKGKPLAMPFANMSMSGWTCTGGFGMDLEG